MGPRLAHDTQHRRPSALWPVLDEHEHHPGALVAAIVDLGAVSTAQGRHDEAKSHLERALAVDVDSAAAVRARALLQAIEKRRPDEAPAR